jgi:hypothetical protein
VINIEEKIPVGPQCVKVISFNNYRVNKLSYGLDSSKFESQYEQEMSLFSTKRPSLDVEPTQPTGAPAKGCSSQGEMLATHLHLVLMLGMCEQAVTLLPYRPSQHGQRKPLLSSFTHISLGITDKTVDI